MNAEAVNSIEHLNVKIFATPDSKVNWAGLIPVFHRWIRENTLPGTLVVVADYHHVPEGPGVMLIAHDAFYSLDNRANALGFLYNQRTPTYATLTEQIRNAYDSAAEAAKKLAKEPELGGQLTFDEKNFQIFINDRALAPNTDETEQEIRPAVEAFYSERFGHGAAIERDSSDPRSLFRLTVKPAQ
jgi:hypothetical protein